VDSAQYAELFLSESREHLTAINQHLLELERGEGGAEPLQEIFRSVHTVKGMSATMGYASVAELSHELESLLEGVQRGALAVTSAMMDVLFAAADLLEQAVEASVGGASDAVDVAPLVARLRALGAAPKAGARTAGDAAPVSGWTIPAPEGAGALVRVRFTADAALRGVRAFMAVQAAGRVGRVTVVVPPQDSFELETFGHEIALRVDGAADHAALTETLRAVGDVEEVAVGELAAGPVSVTANGAGDGVGGATATSAVRQHHFVRIDLRRLDTLMNLIGELTIARGRLARLAAAVGDGELLDTLGHVSRLVGDLQGEIVTSRLAPVWQVFDRFPRVVRDAARTLGKQVDFVVEGKDIELDRSMLDEIGDPLVHLLRNAVDHGIESPEVRAAAGKPPTGRLTLTAARDRSAVAIRVSDDGRGIDRVRVLTKAKALGLVDDAKEQLNDDEMTRLIARAGFSTAERVTDVSGRGVGMDAVYARVRALGGSVDIRSEPGRGTAVTMRLPLTLAILKAVLARVADESYAIPLTHVRETVEVDGDVVRTVQGREVLVLRDGVLPLVRLRDLVRLPRAPLGTPEQAVVVEMADREAAVVVDELTMQQEIVVKQYDAVKDGPTLFGGATILNDGAPALILDVSSLL
jgi:two-component system, chemotaxis family, sensor kinase CheA